MKIASIGFQVQGGAGLSSFKLHREFRKLDQDSRFFVGNDTILSEHVDLIPTDNKHENDWWRLGTVPLKEGIQSIFTSGFSGKCQTSLNKIADWADIILLRWITATVSDFQVGQWAARRTPVVWCLSDMAPITGGCHYSRECTQYETGCQFCPIVASPFRGVPRRNVVRRATLWRGITFVSPSNWLADRAKNSAICRESDVRVIRTGVELDIFKPQDPQQSKKDLGIPQGPKTLLFGANSTSEERKGPDLLWKTLSSLIGQGYRPDEIQVVMIGEGELHRDFQGVPVLSLGKIKSRRKLASAYSAADVTVLPYKEDNLPNVLLESLACGTPVCGFSVGGIPDVLKEGVTGALAVPLDPWDLASSVRRTLDKPPCRSAVRKWAEENISVSDQARQYLELFKELLG